MLESVCMQQQMREAERGQEIKVWNDMNECAMEIGRGSRSVNRRLNGRIGNSEVADVVGKWSVDGVNENSR